MHHPLRGKLRLLSWLVAMAIATLALALSLGSVSIPSTELWYLLWQDDGSVYYRIIHELRLPRILSAFGVGAVLAVAGVLMQVLLRNPLGDPYILGVSGGAAVAVLGAMLLGLPLAWHAPAAFSGALSSMLLLFALAHRGNWNTARLLLTGVVLAAGWSALISFILSLSPQVQLPGMLFWLMGDLGDALEPGLPWLILLIGLAFGLALAPQLNLATRGALRARALGVEVQRLNIQIYLLASLLTAAAVSIAGAIGFIGLIIGAILAMRSKILVMDEPTAGQDYKNYMAFMNAILGLPNFAAILFITHDVDLAVCYANRVILVHEGTIAADGPPAEVLADFDLLRRCRVVPTSLLSANLEHLPHTGRFMPAEALAHALADQL